MRALAAAALVLLAGCAADPRPSEADRLNASGSAALAAGRPRAAASRFAAAASASSADDDRPSLARDLHNHGLALLAAGEARAACDDLAESLRLAIETGATAEDRVRTRLGLATALVAVGSAAAAGAVLDAAEPVEGPLLARLLASRAALALRAGDPALAGRLLAEARASCADDLAAQGAVAVNLGHLARLGNDPAGAQPRYAEAVEAFRKAGDHAGLATALEGQASAAEALGDRVQAARLWRRAAQVPYGGEAMRANRLAEAARLDP